MDFILPSDGTEKDERVGTKIFVRYVKYSIEIYKTVMGAALTAPYLRVLVLQDREDNVSSHMANLPKKKLGTVDTKVFKVLEDFVVEINANNTGSSTAIPSIVKIEKTFKVMKPYLFTGSSHVDSVTRKNIPRIVIGTFESGSGVLTYDLATQTTYTDVWSIYVVLMFIFSYKFKKHHKLKFNI